MNDSENLAVVDQLHPNTLGAAPMVVNLRIQLGFLWRKD
jgi:hypothetical protein